MLRITVAILLTLSLANCQAALDALDDGTTVGFQKCLERGKEQSLETYTVRKFCIDKHERKVVVDLGGRAGWISAYSPDGKYSFQGDVINNSKEFIVTKYEILLSREVAGNSQRKVFEHRWIEPSNSDHFAFSVDDIVNYPSSNNLSRDGSWSILAVYGIRIKI